MTGALLLAVASHAHTASAGTHDGGRDDVVETSASKSGLGCRGLSPASAVDCPSSVFLGTPSGATRTAAVVTPQSSGDGLGCLGLSPASAVDCASSVFLPHLP